MMKVSVERNLRNSCMKYFLFVLKLISFLPLVANAFEKLPVYAGVDAAFRHMEFKTQFGQNLFKRNIPQGNAYVGIDLNEYLSLEGGVESTLSSTKTVILSPGDMALGFQLTEDDPASETHLFKEKMHGWHLSLVVFSPNLPFDQSVRLFGGIGLSERKIHLVNTIPEVNGVSLPEDVVSELQRTFIKKKKLLRLSGGVQKLLTDYIGVRAIINWENTSKFGYIRSLENPTGATIANLKNTFSAGVGLFVKF